MSKSRDELQDSVLELPKNIQQIGSTGNGVKVYLEDYSGTYLRRILSQESEEHGILLGRRKTDKKQTYLFIKAVIGVKPEMRDRYWKYDWNYIYEVMQKYFIEEGEDKLEILGWAKSFDDGKKIDLTELEQMHKNNFADNMTLAFTLDEQDGKEQLYLLENNRYHAVDGYFIYYDKYKPMQKYVLENQPGPCVETEAVVSGSRESYRSILQKRKETTQKHQTVSFLYAASTFLIMIVIILGITTMNNYDKMKKMQAVIENLSTAVLNEEAVPQGQEPMEVSKNSMSAGAGETVQAMSSNTSASGQALQNSEEPQISSPAAGEDGTKTPVPAETYRPAQTYRPAETLRPETASPTEPQAKQTASPGPRKKYEIQPGDTLASISMKVYNTDQMVDKICECNGIENGDQIVAGDVLILP